jgi:hypothetical protein
MNEERLEKMNCMCALPAARQAGYRRSPRGRPAPARMVRRASVQAGIIQG